MDSKICKPDNGDIWVSINGNYVFIYNNGIWEESTGIYLWDILFNDKFLKIWKSNYKGGYYAGPEERGS